MDVSPNRNILRSMALCLTLLLGACATTPEGHTMLAARKAPDLATGAGCNAFGVLEDEMLAVPTEKIRFDVRVVSPAKIAKQCAASEETGSVWGCYHEDTGQAFIAGKDWHVYWHEWCHAKFGPAHVSVAASNRKPKGYLHYIASNAAP
ncbi:MAG: hypothetical protein AAGB27_00545 [Pseudomonadota bacterium]